MNSCTIKQTCFYLLSLFIVIHAESVYNVDRIIIPDYQITLNNKVYTKTSSENQVYDNQWKNKQKFTFSYDDDWKQKGYSVVYWNNASNIWTDTIYCMFFYNSNKQPGAYFVSSINGDTISAVFYKEYYSYYNTIKKLENIKSYSENSKGKLVLFTEEEFLYSQNSKLDSVTTINHDEEYDYVWSTVTEKVRYVNDTMYSIVENTSFKADPDSPSTTYDVEHQYFFSNDGKKLLQGKCLLPGVITERTLYSYRKEDGLPEMDLDQNIESFANKTYKDTLRISYSYSFQDQSLIQTATTETFASEKWVPVSRKIDTYYSQAVAILKNNQKVANSHFKINVFLNHSSNPSFFISASDNVLSIEFFTISGALLYKENMLQSGNDVQLDLSHQRIANYSGPMVAKIKLENGNSMIQKILQIRR